MLPSPPSGRLRDADATDDGIEGTASFDALMLPRRDACHHTPARACSLPPPFMMRERSRGK